MTDLIPKLDTADLLRRRRATAARELAFTLDLSPPRENEAWRDPLTLTFHAIVWDHAPADAPPDSAAVPFGPSRPVAGQYVLARVVELGIEVIAEPGDNLVALLRRETITALRRTNRSTGLNALAPVQTTEPVVRVALFINGVKYSAYDVAAWADLWFYSNPVFVEVTGSSLVAGVN